MARIALAGFLHETNTFARRMTGIDAFIAADAWPGLVMGEALLESVAGANLASAGFIAAMRGLGHEIVPLLWCSANPSGVVASDAYETIWTMLAQQLRDAGQIEGLFLDLHGAMVTEHHPDGEGELLSRLRAVTGPSMPIVAAIDFHANVSARMVELTDAMAAYRSYPHVDMADTGGRAARLLDGMLDGTRPHKVHRQLDFLIPMLAQCTLAQPFAGLVALLERTEAETGVRAAIVPGFPLADTADCGPSILAYGPDPGAVECAAQRLHDAVAAQRPNMAVRLLAPKEALAEAQAVLARGGGPVILADTEDNPGGGASGDTTDILHELVRGDADACLGLLCDPAAAEQAWLAGVGAQLALELGGGSGIGAPPLSALFRVEALGDGEITGTGPFYLGCRMSLGRMACLRIGRVRVVVASRKQQAADQAMFRHVGIEPGLETILVLKSSIHFRADFEPIAAAILTVCASGDNIADTKALDYKRLRAGVSRG
ncbi:M81 family metallopeptidase [Massilia cavernae]|uniref:Microcystinase C n=1 Tax=Massilia cavernae TaxID=2320864 RepID=A0A418XQT0_9BURK|nr:M81 family metallopeptidase [Massilia cavernae]RJG14873.1 M81 family peptidase [Massilia cavernae]